jgi:serine protease Do
MERQEMALSRLILASAVAFSAPLAAGMNAIDDRVEAVSTQERIELIGGGSVTGIVIKEDADRLFIDIGPTIVQLPTRSVTRRIRLLEGKEVDSDSEIDRVYQVGTGEPLPLQEAERNARRSVVRIMAGGSLGSGFIISEDGLVVTNVHVVEGERDIQLTVYLDDAEGGARKQQIENVEIVAMNPFLDLALLRIPDAESLQLRAVKFAAADSLARSQKVFAVGTPRGFERTVSEGIISDPYRSFEGQCYIQTTTPINPGNSGGALFNEAGEVVGVTNMKILQSEGLNFAIPLDQVKFFLDRREAFLFDESQPNTGVRYLPPPKKNQPGD